MTPEIDLSNRPDAEVAALLFAIDPHRFGGIAVRSRADPVRDHFLAQLRALRPAASPWRRLPATVADERLDGGLDLAATLASGRPVTQPGLLAQSDGGVVVLPGAERLPAAMAARLGAALDTGRSPREAEVARFGLVALDEGIDDEALPAGLADRLAFHVDLAALGGHDFQSISADDLATAGRRAPSVVVSEAVQQAITEAALAFGIGSLRPALATMRAAQAAAALAGRGEVTQEDAGVAARLVLAPRATRIPAPPAPSPGEPEARSDGQSERSDDDERERADRGMDETVREAITSALPPGLLLQLEDGGRGARQVPGKAGALQSAENRGRPAGLRRGVPRGGARLNLIETLRAAAPWQPVRRSATVPMEGFRRIEIRRDDMRLTRFKQRSETVTLFAVDASGSLALQRLNEAKGAVELLLAECYIRRDQVALLAFRGTRAEVLLPPTRSLARAKRCLADLAGGGPTPLASALDTAVALADGIRRRGRTPVLVLFTDGRANVTRDGAVDRVRAQADAEDAARAAAATRLRILLIDAAPRPQPTARALAAAMNATYLPLPRAEAAGLTRAIRQAAGT